MLTFLVMLSEGAVSLTDLQHPTKTHSEAVAMMFALAGTEIASGRTVRTKSKSWATTAVEPPAAAVRSAFTSFFASWVDDITRRKDHGQPDTELLRPDQSLKLCPCLRFGCWREQQTRNVTRIPCTFW